MTVLIVGYALGPRIFNRYLSDLPSLGVLAGSLAIAAIVYAPFGFSNLPADPSTEATWSVIGLAAVPTFAGFVVFFALIGEIGPVRTTTPPTSTQPSPSSSASACSASPSLSAWASGSLSSSQARCSQPAGAHALPPDRLPRPKPRRRTLRCNASGGMLDGTA